MNKTSKDGDEAVTKTGKKAHKKKSAKKKAARRGQLPKPKSRLGKKVLICVVAVLVVASISKMVQSNLEKAEERKLAKRDMLLISALDKLHIACTVFWSGVGRGKSCSQDIWEKITDRHYRKVKVTVLKGDQYQFTATSRHAETNNIFQVDRKGNVYLNNDGCLEKVTFQALTPKNLKDLQKQCQRKNSSLAR